MSTRKNQKVRIIKEIRSICEFKTLTGEVRHRGLGATKGAWKRGWFMRELKGTTERKLLRGPRTHGLIEGVTEVSTGDKGFLGAVGMKSTSLGKNKICLAKLSQSLLLNQ